MKSHPRSRLYVGNALQAQDAAVSLHAVKDTPLPLPKLPRDWRLIVAMTCGVVAGMGFVAALIVAIVTSK